MYIKLRLLLSFMLQLFYFNSISQPITYVPPAEMAPSPHYKVFADGKEVFVYESPVASYAIFDFNKPINVTVQTRLNTKWVDIRPQILGIKPVFTDSTVSFKLDKPCNLSVELNKEPNKFPLFLFASLPDYSKLSPIDANVIYFEGGKVHKPGVIRVTSGQTVYIEGGAIVEGIIFADHADRIKITGKGVLLGTNTRDLFAPEKKRFIDLRDCKDVEVSNISIIDGKTWEIVPINCENVRITNVKIVSDNGGDDGIDVVRSRKVKISNCFIRTKDDCIAIKANYNYPDDINTEDIEVSNCVFWNAAWGNALELGFELRSNEVRNIRFYDSDVIHVDKGAVFSIHNGDNSKVSDITFENIRVEDANHKLLDLAIFYSRYSVDGPKTKEEGDKIYLHGAWDGVLKLTPAEKSQHAKFRGTIENVVFKNIYVTDGIFPFSIISGFDSNHIIKNVRIENLVVHGKKIKSLAEGKFLIENAEGVVIK